MKRMTLLALALAAAPAAAQVPINGAGATFPSIIYQDWILTYSQTHPDVKLNYQSIGSGGGIRQFSDGTVDFGGTDAPMTDSAIAAIQGNVLHIPTVLGAIVAIYNLPGVTQQLKFTPDVLADIFLGKVTKWNDARIATINAGVTLPPTDIVVVHRADGSGTSFGWTDYLTKVSPDWASQVGKGTSVNWPVGLGGRGNEGVSATVNQTPGAIGYVELGYATINKMAFGQVRNSAGKFVAPTLEAVTAAAAGVLAKMGATTDFRVSLTNPDGAAAYPIATMTWLLLHKDYADAAGAGDAERGAPLAIVAWRQRERPDLSGGVDGPGARPAALDRCPARSAVRERAARHPAFRTVVPLDLDVGPRGGGVRRRADDLRHAGIVVHRAAARGAAGARRGDLPDRVRPPLAAPARRVPRRAPRRHPQRRVRGVGDLRPHPVPAGLRGAAAQGRARLDAVLP